MNYTSLSLPRQRHAGIAATVAMHAALAWLWQYARQTPEQPAATPSARMQWVDVQARRPKTTVAAAPAQRPVRARARAQILSSPPSAPETAEPDAISEPEAAPPGPKSAYEFMEQARRDLGAIDKDLKKEFPRKRIQAPPDSPQIRLERGIELAAELAPPKWYEQAKVKEIIEPGQYGRKRYRITTAYGTYCATHESIQAPDGADAMRRGSAPKMTNCPEHEQPATTQKW